MILSSLSSPSGSDTVYACLPSEVSISMSPWLIYLDAPAEQQKPDYCADPGAHLMRMSRSSLPSLAMSRRALYPYMYSPLGQLHP